MAKGERGEEGLDPNLHWTFGLGPRLLLLLLLLLLVVVVVSTVVVRTRNLGVEGLLMLENKLNLEALGVGVGLGVGRTSTTSWWFC